MKRVMITVILLLMPVAIFAETVVLKNGKIIEGKVLEKNDQFIKIDDGNRVWKTRYKHISKEDAARLQGLPAKVQVKKKRSVQTVVAQGEQDEQKNAQKSPASEVQYFINHMPRKYSGVFQWEAMPVKQYLTITITGIRQGSGREIEASGSGVYEMRGTKAKIKIAIKIDPQTYSFEMREYDANRKHFVTNGVHQGKISSDFREISANFVQGGRKTGRLRLQAK